MVKEKLQEPAVLYVRCWEIPNAHTSQGPAPQLIWQLAMRRLAKTQSITEDNGIFHEHQRFHTTYQPLHRTIVLVHGYSLAHS